MKKKIIFGAIVIALLAVAMQSCEVNGCNRGDMTSSVDGDESKRMQGDCMNCHGPNGGGKGCFTIGGTVFDSSQTVKNPDAVIYMYTQPNGGGQLVATLDVDQSGNFYTTAIINFGSGLYPVVTSKTSGKTLYMPSSTVSGACGSCHGITNARIWIN